MQEIAEVENFNMYTPKELFYYLIDHLIISPDEEYKDWRYFKEHMIYLCEDYEERNSGN